MRRLLVAGFIVVAAHGAHAADPADVPILRGSYYEAPKAYRSNWQGFYVGGHYGYSSHDFDFSNTTGALQTALLRDYSVFADIRRHPAACGHCECADVGIWRLCRLQLAVGRRGRQRRGELHSFRRQDGIVIYCPNDPGICSCSRPSAACRTYLHLRSDFER